MFGTLLLGSQIAAADLQGVSRNLSLYEFTNIVCHGQGFLTRESVIRNLRLDRGYVSEGKLCRCKSLDDGCAFLPTCDDALHEQFIAEKTKRDGDDDALPCEKLCLAPAPFDRGNVDGDIRAWNCQVMRDAWLPELKLDPYVRARELEILGQSPRNRSLPPIQ